MTMNDTSKDMMSMIQNHLGAYKKAIDWDLTMTRHDGLIACGQATKECFSYDFFFFFFREFDDLGTMHVDTATTISCNNSQLCIIFILFRP